MCESFMCWGNALEGLEWGRRRTADGSRRLISGIACMDFMLSPVFRRHASFLIPVVGVVVFPALRKWIGYNDL